jgi:ribonuclease-3
MALANKKMMKVYIERKKVHDELMEMERAAMEKL